VFASSKVPPPVLSRYSTPAPVIGAKTWNSAEPPKVSLGPRMSRADSTRKVAPSPVNHWVPARVTGMATLVLPPPLEKRPSSSVMPLPVIRRPPSPMIWIELNRVPAGKSLLTEGSTVVNTRSSKAATATSPSQFSGLDQLALSPPPSHDRTAKSHRLSSASVRGDTDTGRLRRRAG
jgi:hypothetical protein